MTTGDLLSADTETIREALREEWEALGHVSLHAHEEQNDIWWADLTGDDIATIRALLNDAAAALGRVEDGLNDAGEPLYDDRFRARLLRHSLSNDEVEQFVDALEAMQARVRALSSAAGSGKERE